MSGFIFSDNANITLNNVILYKIVPRQGNNSIMATQDGTVTIRNSFIFENRGPKTEPTFLFNSDAFIENTANHVIQVNPDSKGSTTAVLQDSMFKGLFNSTFRFNDADTHIINTLFDGRDANRGWPIYVNEGKLTLTNSTLYYPTITKNVDPATYKATHIELINNT